MLFRCCFLIGAIGLCAAAATLERLSLDEMSHKSTSIVRGRIQTCGGETVGSLIYTRCTVSVTEMWKGVRTTSIDVMIPGGRSRGFVQTFSGTPRVTEGNDYVLFLWTGRAGLNQVIGLSQGVFELKKDSKGNSVVSRRATEELMLDSEGRPVTDTDLELSAFELKRRVTRAIARIGAAK